MSSIIQLRRLLSDRFPRARTWPDTAAAPAAVWPTGLPQLDALLHGGIARGAMTEMVSGPGAGSALALRALLRQCHAQGQLMGLVDGLDSFDPGTVEPALLSKLFWARCRNADEALKATDILLRDRNWPLIVLDLKLNPAAQLRKISGTTWYRWQRITRQSGTTFVALTPYALATGVETRVALEGRFDLASWEENEEALRAELKFELARSTAAAAG